ncbi:hypothetical protein FA13DRAFT_1741718 [Coprinellus micaceus]|uniref:Uncharacterized protein n=1 Tax=Coprinellus micaceus TaxID=71717 RepID=A0A4Y7SJ16_COPMI|nr:hypothetical protein FA13DRAFT_1741718 [Coprinellus micaceus]
MSGPARTQRPQSRVTNQPYPCSDFGMSHALPSISSSLAQLYAQPGVQGTWPRDHASTPSISSSTSTSRPTTESIKKQGLCGKECPPHVLIHSDCKAAAGLRGLFTSLLDPLVPRMDSSSLVEEKWVFKSTDGTPMNGTWYRYYGNRPIIAVASKLLNTCNPNTCTECRGKLEECRAIVLSAWDEKNKLMDEVQLWAIAYRPDPDGRIGGERSFRILQSFLDNPLPGSVIRGTPNAKIQVHESKIEDSRGKVHQEMLCVSTDDWRDVDTSKGVSPSLWSVAGRKWSVIDARGQPVLSIVHRASRGITIQLNYRTGRWGVARAGKGSMKADVEQEMAALHFAFLLLQSKQVPAT